MSQNRLKIEIFIPTGPGVGTQFTVDLSRKIEFLPKKGSIIGKNARFSVKTDAEAQILYVQREDFSICLYYGQCSTEQKTLFVIFPL